MKFGTKRWVGATSKLAAIALGVVPAALVFQVSLPAIAEPSTASTSSLSSAQGIPSKYVRLQGDLPTLPDGSIPAGSLAAGTTIKFDVTLRPRNPVGAADYAQQVVDPSSAFFHRYLSPDGYHNRFGPTAGQIASVQSWLGSLGLRSGNPSTDGLSIPVQASAASIEKAFSIGIGRSRLPDGRIARMPSVEPLVPSDMSTIISSIVGLDNVVVPNSSIASSAVPAPEPSRSVASNVRVAPSPSGGKAIPDVGRYVSTPALPHPCAQASSVASTGGVTADQIASAYNINPLFQSGNYGQGVTVGVAEFSSYSSADLGGYMHCYWGDAANPNYATGEVDGTRFSNSAGEEYGRIPLDQSEPDLDVEELEALAPDATYNIYEQNPYLPSSPPPYDVYSAMISGCGPGSAFMQCAVDQNPGSYSGQGSSESTSGSMSLPQVITTSWGNCEQAYTGASATSVIQAESYLFTEASVQGQTVFASSGDSGSEGCFEIPSFSGPRSGGASCVCSELAVGDPASQPAVVAVGGTTLESLSSPPSETTWDDPQGSRAAGASGGGVSSLWLMPSWQQGPGVFNSMTRTGTCLPALNSGSPAAGRACREVPDVSADASPATGAIVVIGGVWQIVGGTSMSAPIWAAIAALGSQGPSGALGLGDIHGALYEAACLGPGASPFNDVTTGNNDYLGVNDGQYRASAGYDMATGLGSPNAVGVVGLLKSPQSGVCESVMGPAPMVTSISPSFGPSAGGTSISIFGSGFSQVAQVLFGSVPATSFRVLSSGEITAVVPSGTSGSAEVAVVNAGRNDLGERHRT